MKEVLCDIAPMDSCHLLLGWAWLCFKTLHLDERSDNAVVDAIKLILLNYSNFSIVKIVVKKIERVK